MPERQLPVMRAATTSERLDDTLRDIYTTAAGQPLGQILDLLGVTDLGGVADTFSDPAYKDALKTGMAPRRVPRIPAASERRFAELLNKFGGGEQAAKAAQPARIGGPGARIPRNSQAGVGTPEANMAKIPRFRSEQGTFVKYKGEWWRIKEQPAGQVYARGETGTILERLPPGKPEPGTVPKVLETRVVNANDLIDDVRAAKGVTEPSRRVNPKFDK